MPAQHIRTDEGYLTELGRQLGASRMETFMQGQAAVQAMSLFLVMAVATAPHAGYSDTALELIRVDAEDVRQAAADWADSCIALADAWRAQRDADSLEAETHHQPTGG